MVESLLLSIVIIITLGIASQWTAWRFQLPAIVVMAVAGLLIGPVFGIINPKEVLGDVFSPLVSLSVAIILFEGSLSLDIRELRGYRNQYFVSLRLERLSRGLLAHLQLITSLD